MPRKSKAFLRRSATAKKGWKTRRHNLRLEAIRKHKPLNEQYETIERRQYKGKEGKIEHIEIIRRGDGAIKEVRIGPRTYSGPGDIEALGSLLQAATEIDSKRHH